MHTQRRPSPSTATASAVRANDSPEHPLHQLAGSIGNRAFTRLVERHPEDTPTLPPIQRLVTSEYMKRFAGEPSSRAVSNDSTYVKILRGLDTYNKWAEQNPESTAGVRRGQLKELLGLVGTWLREHSKKSGRRDFIEGLDADLKQEAHGKEQGKASESSRSPTRAMQDHLEMLERRLTPDLAVDGAEPDNWTFTVVAAIEHPDYRALATERFKMRNSPFRKKGSKQEAAKNVLLNKFRAKHKRKMTAKEQNDEKFLQEVQKLAGAGVGHTYVKLSAKAGDKLRHVFSFGFYPAVVPERPSDVVPGLVIHPDRAHEGQPDEQRRFKDFPIARKDYEKALGRANDMLIGPPSYQMWDYNCTRFAKAVGEAAGVAVPGGYDTVPAAGRLLKAYSPNLTFDALSEDKESYEESTDKEAYEESKKPKPVRSVFETPLQVYEEMSEDSAIEGTRFPLRSDFRIFEVLGEWVSFIADGSYEVSSGYLRVADLQREDVPVVSDM